MVSGQLPGGKQVRLAARLAQRKVGFLTGRCPVSPALKDLPLRDCVIIVTSGDRGSQVSKF